MTSKCMDHCFRVAAIIMLCSVCVILYWAFDRRPPFVILSSDPIPNPAKPGDFIDFQYVVDIKIQGCETEWYREVLSKPDDRTRVYPMGNSSYSNLTIGQHKMSSVVPWRVPIGAFNGDVEVVAVYSSVCNPMQRLFPVPSRSPKTIIHIKDSLLGP